MAQERLLYDFSEPRTLEDWQAIHDVVMGGVSTGGMRATEQGTAAFVGCVSLENSGGFASIRSVPGEWNLADQAGVVVHVRGDGKRYKLNLKCAAAPEGVLYRVAFATRDGEWQTLRFPFSEFRAVRRGRAVPEAPALDASRIVGFGVLISDQQAGPFRLELATIAAYPAPGS